MIFGTNLNPILEQSTVLRIRGSIDVQKSIWADAAGQSTGIAFGICVMSEVAAVAVDGIPNPASQTGADWDGWMFLRSSTLDTVEFNAGNVDVKAKRKIKSGDALVYVVGMATDIVAGTAGPGAIFGTFRILLLLP